jgi:pimeloyl-ACP methyl ester carboxylesterase
VRTLALDLPGYGTSDKPADGAYAFEDFDRAIDGFLEALEVDRVAIVGHDLGGPVATHWALGNQERVRDLGRK